jgi:hypothetical protein
MSTVRLDRNRGASVSARWHNDGGGKVSRRRRFVIIPALLWKSFAAPESDREYTAMLTYLPLNKWRAIPKFMRHLPDSAPASRFRRVNRVCSRRERTETGLLDLIRMGRRGILKAIRPTEASQQGDDGPAPGHGSDGVPPVQGGRVLDPAGLGRHQATHARAIDGSLISDLHGSPKKQENCSFRSISRILRCSVFQVVSPGYCQITVNRNHRSYK